MWQMSNTVRYDWEIIIVKKGHGELLLIQLWSCFFSKSEVTLIGWRFFQVGHRFVAEDHIFNTVEEAFVFLKTELILESETILKLKQSYRASKQVKSWKNKIFLDVPILLTCINNCMNLAFHEILSSTNLRLDLTPSTLLWFYKIYKSDKFSIFVARILSLK